MSETENTSSDNLLLASTREIKKFIVKDLFCRKWTKKDISMSRREKFEFEKTQVPIDLHLPYHKLLEQIIDV